MAYQESAVSVRDWDDVAATIADGLQGAGLLGVVDPATGQPSPFAPFYIHTVSVGSPFLQAVKDTR